MSGSFPEREHRRAKGAPPAEDAERQIEGIRDRVVEAQRIVRELSRELADTLHALDAVRLDITAKTKTTTTTKGKR